MKVPEYRVIIAGSVSFQDYDLLRAKCDAILSEKQRTHNVVVISGTARGADRLGERYAREKGYRLRQFPADWDTHGRSAGPIRNGEMAKNADALIAFWNGHSSGTKNMIETAKRYDLPVRIILTEKPKEDKTKPLKLNFMESNDIDKLRKETADWAVKYIKSGTGFPWLRDKFNALCDAMGAEKINPDDISFELDDLTENLQKAPWVSEIAAKPADSRTAEDISRVVEDFVCQNWLMKPEEVTTKNVADVLKVADPLSHRHLVAQKVAIDCIHALDKAQLEKLDKELEGIVRNPNIGLSRGLGR